MSHLDAVDAVELFCQELDLCAVNERESIVVLAEPASRPDYAAAAFAAAKRLGAAVMQVTLPGGSPVPLPSVRTGTGYGLRSLEGNPLAIEMLKGADLVVDVTLEGFIHTPLLAEILDAQTRVLFVCEPLDVLARNLPTREDKERAQAGVAMLDAAATMHITSDAGTDLSVDVTDAHPGFQCGFTDDPGRWDHWPSTMVLCWPDSDGVNGTLVLQPGDILFPFKEYVRDQVHLEIESGRIVSIGSGSDANQLRQFFDDSGDETARFTSHMGWGLMRNADWSTMGMYSKESIMGMDGRCLPGNFLLSTGPNPFADRWTPFHLDIPMRGCSIALDDELVIDHGRLLADDQR